MIRFGVIGFGYWGPNLARNLAETPGARVAAIADLRPERRAAAAARHPGARVGPDPDAVIQDPSVDAIAIATPVESHYALAKAALLAGKHVLVEKPLAASSGHAAELIDLAAARRLVLMVDHTFIYTGAVRAMVGGKDFEQAQFNLATQAHRQAFFKHHDALRVLQCLA